MLFPNTRLRRNRSYGWLRDLVAEYNLSASDLIWPVFVIEGQNLTEKISSMPGICRFSIDLLVEEAKKARDAGIKSVALFPAIEQNLKSLDAKEASNPNNLMCRAIQALKTNVKDLGIICDVALDPYTTHGHDGILIKDDVDNDKTIEQLCLQAQILVESGADVVAPSDMMDGRIGAIRKNLDKQGYQNTIILAYSTKYASNFYGPFRDAIGSQTNLNKANKSTYQMDYRNMREAIRETELDIKEGADIIMVKPGMPYLDIIKLLKDNFNIPIFTYQVSGEYSMIRAASDNGWLNYEQTMLESLVCLKRAGANAIFTYAAMDVIKYI